MDFSRYPDYPHYRAMRVTEPMTVGYDVFALQSALADLGFSVGSIDGYFGAQTKSAVFNAQADFQITEDGIAGLETQRRICQRMFTPLRQKYDLPYNLLHGQVEHESSFWLGNYTPLYSNGSYDAGVTQRNTAHTSASLGFNVPDSLDALANNVAKYFDKFEGVVNLRRRWQLAQGSWNAPAYACYIANEEGANVPRNQTAKPSADARKKIEAYMAAVSTYLKV